MSLPNRNFTSSEEVIIQFLDDQAVDNYGRYMELCLTWLTDALRDIGSAVEVYR